MCFVFISEQTATCATCSINWLVFITEMKSVYCAVRTGSLNKAVCTSSLKSQRQIRFAIFKVKDYLSIIQKGESHMICGDGVLREFESSVGTFCLYYGHQILSMSFNMDHVTDLMISIVIGNDMAGLEQLFTHLIAWDWGRTKRVGTRCFDDHVRDWSVAHKLQADRSRGFC